MGGFNIISQSGTTNPLPRCLDFVKPVSLQNGLIQHELAPITPNPVQSRVEIDTRWIGTFGAGSGLHNLGNTCFLNSILQCLTHTAPLVNHLITHQHQLCSKKKQFCFLCFLKAHIPAALAGGPARAPRALVSNLRLLSRSFKPGRQEDAHELLCKCLEALERSCQPKLVNAIFGGKFRSRVRCQECSYASDAFDPFQDISLEISRANSIVTALKHFTSTEVLSGNNKYLCIGCKKRVVAHKQLTIDQAPPVLTVQLKRFTYTGAKIGKPVQYEHELDLGPFLSDRGQSIRYQLFGLVVHLGSGPRSGHYIAYVKTSAGLWYLMDDASVNKIGSDSVLRQNPYLLFYVRQSPDPIHRPSPKQSTSTMTKESVSTRPDTVLPLASGGDVVVNSTTVGGISATTAAAECAVMEVGSVPMIYRQISLPNIWRYHRLRPALLPSGRASMITLKPFKSARSASIVPWVDSIEQSAKMRIYREHRDQTMIAPRSDHDLEYDQGRVRKVKKERHQLKANVFQKIADRRQRS